MKTTLILLVVALVVVINEYDPRAMRFHSKIARDVYMVGAGDAAHLSEGQLRSWFAQRKPYAQHVVAECGVVPGQIGNTDRIKQMVCSAAAEAVRK